MRNLSIAIVLLLAACGDAKKNFDEGFKQAFEKNFAESCTKGAMDGGVPAENKPKVEQLCGCTAKKLVARHTTVELTAMGAGRNQELVEAAVKECAN